MTGGASCARWPRSSFLLSSANSRPAGCGGVGGRWGSSPIEAHGRDTLLGPVVRLVPRALRLLRPGVPPVRAGLPLLYWFPLKILSSTVGTRFDSAGSRRTPQAAATVKPREARGTAGVAATPEPRRESPSGNIVARAPGEEVALGTGHSWSGGATRSGRAGSANGGGGGDGATSHLPRHVAVRSQTVYKTALALRITHLDPPNFECRWTSTLKRRTTSPCCRCRPHLCP